MVLVAEVEKSGEIWVVGHIENTALDWLVAFKMLADLWEEMAGKDLQTGTLGQFGGYKFGSWGIKMEFEAMETKEIT